MRGFFIDFVNNVLLNIIDHSKTPKNDNRIFIINQIISVTTGCF